MAETVEGTVGTALRCLPSLYQFPLCCMVCLLLFAASTRDPTPDTMDPSGREDAPGSYLYSPGFFLLVARTSILSAEKLRTEKGRLKGDDGHSPNTSSLGVGVYS